ncbi:hypothetical protein ACFQZ4_42375 [Catellatospora coxensis]
MLLDEDQRDQRTAAARFRALDSEYVVFAHGGPDGPMVNGRTVTAAQLRDMINDDPARTARTSSWSNATP